ncbi:MAG: DUF4249 domain-containing protein [Candidatus Symbiothrix sp.]|jgi:hypothetical protein|nr:DUF4249 domain-containing protein [Candidatus Symbiothrix sp.]
MKRILFFMLLSLGYACENNIEFDAEETQPLITLKSLLTPGSKVSVQLTASRFFLSDDEGFNSIYNATVVLWKDDSLIDTMSLTSFYGNYESSYIPKGGDKLTVKAEAPGYDPVSCSAEVLHQPEWGEITSNIQATQREIDFPANDRWLTLDVFTDLKGDLIVPIKDTPGVREYYALQVYLKTTARFQGASYTLNVSLPIPYTSNDLVFDDLTTQFSGFDDDDDTQYGIFSDDLFDGQTYPLKINVAFSGVENYFPYDQLAAILEADETPVIHQSVYVRLNKLSESCYLFSKSVQASRATEGLDLFYEPIQIYSNIEGGVGLIGSYATTEQQVEVSVSSATSSSKSPLPAKKR